MPSRLYHWFLHRTGWAPCELESRWDRAELRVYFRTVCACGHVMRDWHALGERHG